MAFLSPRERRTLAMLCDTLLPALPAADDPLFRLSAADVNLAARLEESLEQVTDEDQRAALRQFFALLENGLLNGISAGHWSPFSDMPLDARTQLLRGWAVGPFEAQRRAFNSIKRLAMFLFYTLTPEGSTNPSWQALDYRLPVNPAADAPRPLRPLAVSAPTTLTADVLVIGSGAGGGVVAGELSAAGLDVLVVEKGGYYAERDYTGSEYDANQTMYEKQGALTNADASIPILAGSVLGGGTTINWCGSLRTPDYVLEEWERQFGFSGVAGGDFQRSLDAVTARMSINSDPCPVNQNVVVFERGLRALGRNVTVIPRNAIGCQDCGFCHYGCAFGAKQGTLRTYLQDAVNRGARVLVHAHVDTVLHSGGVAQGAHVTVRGADGARHPVTVKAKAVVVAAGSIHTPAVLLRSGLTNPNIGHNLRLHPTTVTSALFDDPIEVWRGAPMTRLTADFDNLDGRGYGFRLMTAPGHPGTFALATAWTSGAQHRAAMRSIAHTANIIAITRDYFGGKIVLDKRGAPVIHYQLHPYDARHVQRGMLEALRTHVAAGAREVTAPHNAHPTYRVGKDGSFTDFLMRVEGRGLKPSDFALFSAHQMASARIAGSAATGAATPDGETYEVKNLFIADASAMPTCSGVNPMLTILGLAHFLAQRIRAKLG